MTTRQQRRAAERAARKQARKIAPTEAIAPTNNPPSPERPFPERATADTCANVTPEPTISDRRLAANRANAQHSTGPKTAEGKAAVAKNALKTALTGRTVLLPTDDADRYEQHLASYEKAMRPIGERECEIVQALADAAWRVDRIPGLEEALYYKGAQEFAAQVAELDPAVRSTMLRMHTYLAYERQFRNLHTQEMRLHRLREKLNAELKQLQKEREQKEKDELSIAAKLYTAARHDRQPFNPADHGFEFSTADVQAYLRGVRAATLTDAAFTNANRLTNAATKGQAA